MIGTLLAVFIFLAAVSLIWWGISRLTLPEPVKTVVLVILGLIILYAVYQFIAGGHLVALR